MEEKKLSEFLKENGAYGSFIENCLNDEDTLHSIKAYSLSNIEISDGFTWAKTKQGDDYWVRLFFNNFCKLNIIYDMDEILYKEYGKRNMKEISEQNPITKDIVENDEVENTKQEFQIITLNGIQYNLIPKEISVGYITNWQDKVMKAETTEEYLKRKFETNDYICIMRDIEFNGWVINKNPSFYQNEDNTMDYKLIKKEHKEIIEAYLKDNTLKIQYRWLEEDWKLLDNFIEKYDEDMQIRIAKKEFEPFILYIDVKTLDEAKSLWNRFSINNSTIKASLDISFKIDKDIHWEDYNTWDYLDDILRDLGEEPDATR